jgi:hypothetical protein
LVNAFSVNAIFGSLPGVFFEKLPKRFLNSSFLDFLGFYGARLAPRLDGPQGAQSCVHANPDSQFQQACPAICVRAVPSTRPLGDGNDIAGFGFQR